MLLNRDHQNPETRNWDNPCENTLAIHEHLDCYRTIGSNEWNYFRGRQMKYQPDEAVRKGDHRVIPLYLPSPCSPYSPSKGDQKITFSAVARRGNQKIVIVLLHGQLES